MVIDEKRGTVKECMESRSQIEDAVPFHHGESYGILVYHLDKVTILSSFSNS